MFCLFLCVFVPLVGLIDELRQCINKFGQEQTDKPKCQSSSISPTRGTKVQTLGAISESIYEQDREQDTAPHWPKRCYLSAEPISRGLVASAGKLDWTSASPPVRWAASGKGLHGPLGKVYLLWNK